MNYLSLFSGIEAATVAWHPLGWKPVAFSEIDKTASKFLAETYPHVPNLGDVTKITEEMVKSLGKIDLIIGGSPCQAFSVAGLRKGLDDPRGNLTLEFVRIVSLVMPEFVVWENVPGVLSDKTNAFLCLMDGLSELGYAIDTQELDAQEFYVPQRRKRVFLVCRKIGAKKKTHISWKTTGLLEQGILDFARKDVNSILLQLCHRNSELEANQALANEIERLQHESSPTFSGYLKFQNRGVKSDGCIR